MSGVSYSRDWFAHHLCLSIRAREFVIMDHNAYMFQNKPATLTLLSFRRMCLSSSSDFGEFSVAISVGMIAYRLGRVLQVILVEVIEVRAFLTWQ